MSTDNIDLVKAFLRENWSTSTDIAERRSQIDAVGGGAPLPDGVTAEATTLGGRAAEKVTPSDPAPGAGLLYLHGGAYNIGSLDSHRPLVGRLAAAAGLTTWALDYRLAPEHPFPAAVEDAVAAFDELVASGVPASALAIAGDSAGGGLTMATLLALRDRGGDQPAAGVCLSPWADLTQSSGSYDALGDSDPMLTRDGLTADAGAYLAGADPKTPLASPIFADLTGLPPLRIDVGEDEVLLDDSITLAANAGAAGVDVHLERWPRMIHVFQAFPEDVLPESGESLKGIAAFLRARTGVA
jgi:acetyl esterase/lipase